MGCIDLRGLRINLVAYVLTVLTVVVLHHPVPASCTRDQCILDCSSPTTAELQANLSSDDYSIDMPQRLVGPTARAPSTVQPYPHALAPFPLESPEFCRLGCAFFSVNILNWLHAASNVTNTTRLILLWEPATSLKRGGWSAEMGVKLQLCDADQDFLVRMARCYHAPQAHTEM